jgi:DNA-directed RNA polymerase subunit N (RpoN/RPB10)
MIYMVCPTCGKLLANIEELVEKIAIIDDGEKKIKKEKGSSNKQKQENLKILFDKYGYVRYCCRMRILTYIDEASIVK